MNQNRKTTGGGTDREKERVQGILDELRRAFLAGTPQRLNAIALSISAVSHNPADRESLDRLRLQFHNLAGLAGTHGMGEVTDLGRRAEVACQRLLETGEAATREDIERWQIIHDRFAALFAAAANGTIEHTPLSNRDDRPLILLAGRHVQRPYLAAALEECGYETRRAPTFDVAVGVLRERKVRVIVAEAELDGGTGAALIGRARAAHGGASIGAIIVAEAIRFDDKVEAIRCGADACFDSSSSEDAVIRRVKHLVARAKLEAPRILYVEDDPDHAAFAQRILGEAGYSVQICSNPAKFEDAFEVFHPDLVILDINLQHEVSGLDIARYIRQDERNATLPVIFLTVAGQMHARIEGMLAGGDDQILKPLSPALLLSVVSARLERARLLKSLLERDGLTGLLTHTAFAERMKAAHADSQRHPERRRVLALIDLDHFKSINDEYGHPVGDRVLMSLSALLSRRTRRNDVSGRFGGEEFALIIDDVTVEQAAALMSRILDEFAAIEQTSPDGRSFRVVFSAGVAALAPGISVDEWRQAADTALYAAKRQGRRRVAIAGESAADPLVIPFRRKA